MKMNPLLLGTVLCVSALSAQAETVDLSGTVYDKSGNGLFGAKVFLASGGLSTITNASGIWALSGNVTTGIGNRNTTSQAVTSHLLVQDGHVVLNYSGNDLLGRSRHAVSVAPSLGSAPLARSAATIIDTLCFSWKDSVRLRLPLASYEQSNLATIIDTSSDSGVFTDSRDAQTYKWVRIGKQTWMAQNLNFSVDSSWCYDDLAANCATYGRLYQWAAAMGLDTSYNSKLWQGADSARHQGICPSGWHVPTDTEWGTLLAYAGADSSRITLSSTSGWNNSDNGTNVYGFNIQPAGNYTYYGTFVNLRIGSFFWSSTESGSNFAWDRSLSVGHLGVEHHNGNYKIYGFSLRCLQN